MDRPTHPNEDARESAGLGGGLTRNAPAETGRSPMTSRASMEELAMVALDAGRVFMETGASGRFVDELVERIARGLGAERVDLRLGYASLAITVGIGGESVTRMRRVGPHGVNQRLGHGVQSLAARVARGGLTVADTRAELDRLVRGTPGHPAWLVALAVGIACASFGNLLGLDWAGVGPVFAASSIGQAIRALLHRRRANAFITVTVVAFVASALAGVGAQWVGSRKVDTAMVAAVLLLVPGVPALNAQNDILEGRPTLGSARAVWVAVVLVFTTVGIWMGQTVLGMAH